MARKSGDHSKSSWNAEHMRALIDAYKEEECLYAVQNPNYHNKHLRTEALNRVAAAVSAVRPDTNAKECYTKFHNMRNQFNVENSKVKSSLKSGVGTSNVYKPSLWYFELLKFLEEHVISRKSLASPFMNNNVLASVSENTEEIIPSQFDQDGRLSVLTEDDTQIYDNVESQIATTSSTHIIEPNLETTPSTSVSPLSPIRSPTTSSSSGFVDKTLPPKSARIQRKRRIQHDDAYIGAIESIAESFRQPITIAGSTQPSVASHTTVAPGANSAVDSCMKFFGSILNGFTSEELKLEVMNTLVQTVINARTSELERVNRK